MARGNEKKVRPGTKMSIPASTWNQVIDSIKERKLHRNQQGPPDSHSAPIDPVNTIRVNNNSSYDVDAFSVLAIHDPLYDVEIDPFGMKRRMSFQSGLPGSATDPFVITGGPIGIQEIGTGVVSGITIAYVKMNDPSHEWANPVPDKWEYLESVECGGQARILWHGPVSGSGSDNKSIPNVATSGSGSDRDAYEIAVINLIGAVACEATGGADTVDFEYNSSGTYEINVTANTWQTVGVSLNIAVAGTYEIYYNALGYANFSTAPGFVHCRIKDVPPSESILVAVQQTAQFIYGSCNYKGLYTFAAPATVVLEAKKTLATFSVPGHPIITNTSLGFRKVNV